MNRIEKSVSLHPYFKVNPGQLDAAKALLPEFVARSAGEAGSLYYEFTLNDDVVFCRESYVDAAAVLTHLANVGDILDRMLAISTVLRLEVHGPAEELDKLRAPLGGFNPAWFIYQCGVVR
jgi:quinol monooxygenase YgiN